MSIPLASPESLAHRAQISSLVSSLRPTRLRTSVFNLAAHRIPTLWTLYRKLLRDSPTEEVRYVMENALRWPLIERTKGRWRVKEMFHRDKSMRKAVDVKERLIMYHKWADMFTRAKQGDARSQAVLQRYSRLLVAHENNRRMRQYILEDIAWRNRLRNRTILTGSYMRPTWYNGPLPRMKPLPDHVRELIRTRRQRREHRVEEYAKLSSLKEDLERENEFEVALLKIANKHHVPFEGAFVRNMEEWKQAIVERLDEINETFKRDNERAARPFPPEMLAQIKAARIEKIANKTRELERERRGEMTRRALKRKRKGPPAHILATMTEKERRMDKISRSVSEVGYVAKVKKMLGHKLKNPDAWKVEIGGEEDRERLDKMLREIEAENARRRARADAEEERSVSPDGSVPPLREQGGSSA